MQYVLSILFFVLTTKALAACDYESKYIYLIPDEFDNVTCTRPEIIKNGAKIRILSDSIKIDPTPIKLPGCFKMKFKAEVTKEITNAPINYFAKVEFQLFEVPEVEKLGCVNGSANGCGGVGNNCYYCDICDTLFDLENKPPRHKSKLQNQLSGLQCPNEVGKSYEIEKELCFKSWDNLDSDNNCKLDFLEDLDDANNGEGTKITDTFAKTGKSTFIIRLYLAHNATDQQMSSKEMKEKQIADFWAYKLASERSPQLSDEQFNNIVKIAIQTETDRWHREKYLPWLLYENQLACLKIVLKACDKPPIQKPSVGTDFTGPVLWWQKQVSTEWRCP